MNEILCFSQNIQYLELTLILSNKHKDNDINAWIVDEKGIFVGFVNKEKDILNLDFKKIGYYDEPDEMFCFYTVKKVPKVMEEIFDETI